MRFNSLDEWLGWQESCHPREIDLGLERTRQIAERLDLLPSGAKVITVAGTNGKGSCVATLEHLLTAQGVSAGAYTSPHLLRYNERIRINGVPVCDEEICCAFEAIDQARGEISLSYFEFGTLAAWWLFKERGVTYWLLEVGLGGRLDATNVIDADVAVVTSVDLDHQHWLGNDREAIGREKAGIFRAGKPAISADRRTPLSVRSHARSLGCELYLADEAFSWQEVGQGQWHLVLEEQGQKRDLVVPAPGLPQPSVAAALQALALLGQLPKVEQLQKLLPELQLAGRFQRFDYRGRCVYLDVAHNPAAAEYLAARLASEGLQQLTTTVAMMADKDIPGSLKPLMPFVSSWYAAGLPDTPRAAQPEAINQALQGLGVASDRVQCASDVQSAIDDWATRPKDTVGPLLIAGSFYTVAAAMHYLLEERPG